MRTRADSPPEKRSSVAAGREREAGACGVRTDGGPVVSAYTPGPWRATVSKREGARIDADGRSVAWVGADETQEMMDGRVSERMSAEALANARLICAAPDLLAALEKWEACIGTVDAWGQADEWTRFEELALAALAKVRGAR